PNALTYSLSFVGKTLPQMWGAGFGPGAEIRAGISRSLQHVIFGVDEKEVRDLATAQRAPRATGAWRDRDQGAPRERADAALVGEDGGQPDLHRAGRRAGGGACGCFHEGWLHERLGVLRAGAGPTRGA